MLPDDDPTLFAWNDYWNATRPAAVLRMVAGLRTVATIHGEGPNGLCSWCYSDEIAYPCPTLLAVAAALGVEA